MAGGRPGVMVLMGVKVGMLVVVADGSASLVGVGDNTAGNVGGTALIPPVGAAIRAAIPRQ